MRPLRIVIVFLEAPAPFGSAASRWFAVLLKELVARGHKVTAFAACSKQNEMDDARAVFPPGEYDLRLYPIPERRGFKSKLETIIRPYSYMFSGEMKRDLQAELDRGYDILHLEHIWSGWLGLRNTRSAILNVLSLYCIDLAEVPIIDLKSRIQRLLLYRAEKRLAAAYLHLVTLSERLKNGLAEINSRADISIIPLGIDTTRYPFISENQQIAAPTISVIGSMNWYPTHSAAVRLMTRLWPTIKSKIPDAKVQLVGWGAKESLKEYIGLPDVTITENVPDTRPYFERTGVLLYAPARGSGMKVKVLEALAYGVPVVTTSEGIEGLPARDGIHAGICDDDAGLIERTVLLLSDIASRNRMRVEGRRLLESHCGPTPTVDRFEALYRKVCGSNA